MSSRDERAIDHRDPATTGLGIWLQRELRPGGVMIDVGANVGDYTVVAAQVVGPAGRVFAFEPGPDNLGYLRERCRSLSHVSVIPAAVGGQSGTVSLFLDRRDARRHSLAAGNVGKAGHTVTVAQIALDDFSERLSRLDIVKIDAQGAELNIVRGARRLLGEFRPAMTLELWPHGLQSLGASANLLLTALEELGYSVYRLSAKGILKPERFVEEFLARPDHRWHSINIVAVPS